MEGLGCLDLGFGVGRFGIEVPEFEAMGCLLQRLLQKTVRFVSRHLDFRPMSPGRFLIAPSHGSNEA